MVPLIRENFYVQVHGVRQVGAMDSSFFGRMTEKRLQKLANKKMKITQQEKKEVDEFNRKYSKDTITEILDIVHKKGHPSEVELSDKFKDSYYNNNVTVESMLDFSKLYMSNRRFLNNKNDEDIE